MSQDGIPEIVVRVFIPDLKANVSVCVQVGMSVSFQTPPFTFIYKPTLPCAVSSGCSAPWPSEGLHTPVTAGGWVAVRAHLTRPASAM